MEKKIMVKGLHCNACKMILEDVGEDTGVEVVSVDVKSGAVFVRYLRMADLKLFAEEVEAAGDYHVVQ